MANIVNLDSSAIEVISRTSGEPEWARNLRVSAWAAYAGMALPTRKDEEWRRTDLSTWKLEGLLGHVADRVASIAALPAAVREALGEGAEQAALQVQLNSTVVLQQVPALPNGVIFTDLETAVREHADKVQPHLFSVVKPGENKFTALNAAAWSGGFFLYVPRNVAVEVPLELLTYVSEARAGVFGHTLIVAEEGAEVTVVERFASADGLEQPVFSGVVEIVTAGNAHVRYCGIQNWGNTTHSYSLRRAIVGPDANVEWVGAEFGAANSRMDQESRCTNQGGNSRSLLIYLGTEQQKFDLSGQMHHHAPNTMGDLQARGAVRDTARAVYRGVGHIYKEGPGSATYQKQSALMLSEQSRSDAIPMLFIDNQDVAAGHSATAGQVDQEQLFYLMCRGISRSQAERMIVEGFLTPVIEQIPVQGVRDQLLALLARRLG